MMSWTPEVKSILKSAVSEKEPPASNVKTAKFDELNVLATFHPSNKDYGHMIIDEPKTPFIPDDTYVPLLDSSTLKEKLRIAALAETPSFGMDEDDESSGDDDYPESLEEKIHRLEFERRRKAHYREFYSVDMARELIEKESEILFDSEDFVNYQESVVLQNVSDESCSIESCLSMPSEEGAQQRQSSTSRVEDDDTTSSIIEIDPEPELDPAHPCYQHLAAEKPSEEIQRIGVEQIRAIEAQLSQRILELERARQAAGQQGWKR